jgi:hypothetical protein
MSELINTLSMGEKHTDLDEYEEGLLEIVGCLAMKLDWSNVIGRAIERGGFEERIVDARGWQWEFEFGQPWRALIAQCPQGGNVSKRVPDIGEGGIPVFFESSLGTPYLPVTFKLLIPAEAGSIVSMESGAMMLGLDEDGELEAHCSSVERLLDTLELADHND